MGVLSSGGVARDVIRGRVWAKESRGWKEQVLPNPFHNVWPLWLGLWLVLLEKLFCCKAGLHHMGTIRLLHLHPPGPRHRRVR